MNVKTPERAGQPVAVEPPRQTAMERLEQKAVEAAKWLGGNVRDSTPFTREGFAKGMATMAAELRGGLLDLQKMVVHAFPDSQQQEAVLGMVGLPTPSMVDRANEVIQLEPAHEHERTRGR